MIFFVYLCLLIQAALSQKNSYCNVFGRKLICKDFQSFYQLDLSNIQAENNETFRSLEFDPSGPLFLDYDLDLKNIQVENNYEIIFKNLEGFNLLVNPLVTLDIKKKAQIKFVNSKFEYLYNKKPISVDDCNYLLKNEILISLLDTAESFILEKPVYSNNPICPILFKDANVFSFDLSNINSNNKFSFIDNSLLDFGADFKTKIFNFTIDSSDFSLDSSIMDKNVFQGLFYFLVTKSYLRNIQTDLFSTFYGLKSLRFELYNFDEFVKLNAKNEWIKYINSNVTADLNDENVNFLNSYKLFLELVLTDLKKTYNYPEKDFCLFKNFPHNRLVFPVIRSKDNLECTCTLMWLLKYKRIYQAENENPMDTSSVHNCLAHPNFDQMIEDCNFEQKLKDCANSLDGDDNDKENNGLMISTIVLGIAAFVFAILFILTIYFFKFKRRNSPKQQEEPLSFSTMSYKNHL